MLVLAASTAFAPGGGRVVALGRPRNSFASPLMLSNWLNSDATLTRDEADGVVVPGPTAEAEAAAAEAEADALAKAEALAKATAALGSLRSALDQAQVELAEQLEATARERALKEGAVAERESLRVQLEAAADERERRAKELFSARAELEATAAALRGSKASLEATRLRMTETQVAAAEALAATERERDGARAALRVTQRELASTSAALDSTMLQLLELQARDCPRPCPPAPPVRAARLPASHAARARPPAASAAALAAQLRHQARRVAAVGAAEARRRRRRARPPRVAQARRRRRRRRAVARQDAVDRPPQRQPQRGRARVAEGAAAQLAHGVVKGCPERRAAGHVLGLGYTVCVRVVRTWLSYPTTHTHALSPHILYTGPGLLGSYVGQFAECCGYPGGGGVGAHPPASAGGVAASV